MFWHGIRATLDRLGNNTKAGIMRGTNTPECSCISCWRGLGFVLYNGCYLVPTAGMLLLGSEARLGSCERHCWLQLLLVVIQDCRINGRPPYR